MSLTVPPPVAAAPRRPVALLAGAAAALVAAFVLLPGRLASLATPGFADEHALTVALRRSFAAWWRTGQAALSPDLAHVVDYWFRYHVAKGMLAAILLAVLVPLTARLWRARAGTTGVAPRAGLAAASAAAAGLAVAALLAVMANLQGVVAPFGSMFPMLSGPPSDVVLDQAAAAMASGARPPAVGVMLADYARYHAAMAVIASVVSLAGAALAVVAWRRRLRLPALAAGMLVLVTAVVAVANTGTALEPEPGFLDLLRGSW